MHIVLTATESSLADAWQRFCGDLPNVTIHRGSILDLASDAVVSPANSYGFMDGGIDMVYSQFFGWHVQTGLQELISQRHHGELLVGSAEIVATSHRRIPYLIAAPTMRVPMILRDTINPYLAARAVLLLIEYGHFPTGPHAEQPIKEVVETVAFPGLGTGVGRVGPNTCAHQVRTAIEDVVLKKRGFPTSWTDAQTRHQQLYSDSVRDLQYD
jgi:O-acetyl-ADP-ribose deacetylase (regulator of RNase III)